MAYRWGWHYLLTRTGMILQAGFAKTSLSLPRFAGHAKDILASEVAINLKVNQVLDALHKGGYAFHQTVPPEALLIHPANRGGLMVNSHDVHAKGYTLLQVGPDLSKLRRSVCFEISNQEHVKKMKVWVQPATCWRPQLTRKGTSL